MPQTFQPGAVLAIKLALIAFGALCVIGFVLLAAWTPTGETAVNEMTAQPIPFSHKHHVGDVGLDCRFCHTTVETSARPGMPSAQLCLTCHSQLFADQALLAPLKQAVSTHQPIAWIQLTRLPDYVYFDHSVHVAKGVACIECHGRVDQLSLMRRPEEMKMKWCFACHQDPGPHLRYADEVFSMPPRAMTEAQAATLNRFMQIERRQRMTDCSTCHR